GLYGTEFGVALLATFGAFVYAILVWLAARYVDVVDGERTAIEADLRTLNETLEQRVAERTAEVDERAQELRALHRIDQAILANPEMESVGRVIVQLVAELTKAHHCFFDVPDEERRFVRNLAVHGLTSKEMEDLNLDQRRMGEGLPGWVMATGQPSTVSNMLADERFFRRRDLIKRIGFVSAMSVPIIIHGQVTGALTVIFREEREFSPEEIQQMARLGVQLAIAVQTAQHLSQIHSFTIEAIIALAEAIEHRDPYTGGHCRRLGAYSKALAQAMGLTPAEQEVVRYGALLHDIGKVGVPEVVLMKPASLTPEEWVLMKQHPFIGAEIAKKVGFLRPMAPLIYHHHERYDGAGYMDRLQGERIPLGSRIIAVVDAYDAMITDRPYRRAQSEEEA
ncbi:MAG: metal dependent phosphohydrolase, partial [Dehalococcoidia bacterium]|nr:metal dependent phosphohydrolase [Dehalococcoidia bacterium]